MRGSGRVSNIANSYRHVRPLVEVPLHPFPAIFLMFGDDGDDDDNLDQMMKVVMAMMVMMSTGWL